MSDFVKPQIIKNLADDIRNGTKTANIIGTVLLHPTKEEKEELVAYITQGDRSLTDTIEGCKNLIFTEEEFPDLEPIHKSRAMTLCKFLLSLAAAQNKDEWKELKTVLDTRIAVDHAKTIQDRLQDIDENLDKVSTNTDELTDENKQEVKEQYSDFLVVIDEITKTVDNITESTELFVCNTVDAVADVAETTIDAGVKVSCEIAEKTIDTTKDAISLTDFIGGNVIGKLYSIIGKFNVIEGYKGISELSKSIVGETYNRAIMTAFNGLVASLATGQILKNLDFITQILRNLIDLAKSSTIHIAWGGIFLGIGLGLDILLKAGSKISTDATTKIKEIIDEINKYTNDTLDLDNAGALEILENLFTKITKKRVAEAPAEEASPPAEEAPAEKEGGKRKTKKNKKKMTKSKKHFKKQSRKILKKLSKKKKVKKH